MVYVRAGGPENHKLWDVFCGEVLTLTAMWPARGELLDGGLMAKLDLCGATELITTISDYDHSWPTLHRPFSSRVEIGLVWMQFGLL
jgi:hypothetical protein